MIPRIAITPGEPGGIGPDLVIALAARNWPAAIVALADPEMLASRAALLGIKVRIETWRDDDPLRPHRIGTLAVLPVPLAATASPGLTKPANAHALLKALEIAVDGCLGGRFDALVTGPMHKAVINEAGIPFTGHTEFIAERCGTKQPVMMLVAGRLRVALATTHLPLAAVPGKITPERIGTVLQTLDRDLRGRFGIARPRILVCGLNPHAGEGGHLGREEIEVIIPVCAKLRGKGIDITGPVPADTAFLTHTLEGIDAVLAMYHDQGLPVLKREGFGQAVNITLGLPIVRTSVDHGTALELAGTGLAQTGSLVEALTLAITLSRNERTESTP